MKTTIKINQVQGDTIITNDRGRDWIFSNMVAPSYALGAVIFGTIVPWYDNTCAEHDEFEITLTIKTL